MIAKCHRVGAETEKGIVSALSNSEPSLGGILAVNNGEFDVPLRDCFREIAMLSEVPGRGRITVGADKAYDMAASSLKRGQ